MSKPQKNMVAEALEGVRWTTLSAVVVSGVQFAQLVVLARMLGAEQFGLLTIILVVLNFVNGTIDLGLNNAVVQDQTLDDRQLSNLYWVSIVSGVLFLIVFTLLAGPISDFFERSELSSYLVAVSFMFPVIAAGSQFRALLQKSFSFDSLAKIEIAAAVSAFFVLLFALQSDAGVWSFIYAVWTQQLITSGCLINLGFTRFYTPGLQIFRVNIWKAIRFGLFETGNRAINLLSANLDKLLIARVIGMEAVGFYNLAWQLVLFPLSKLNPIFDRIAYPLYSKLNHVAGSMPQAYLVSQRFMLMISAPILAFLIVFAKDVTWVFYGDGFQQTALLIPVLGFAGILKAIGNPGGAAMLSVGRADACFYWNVFWLVSLFLILTATAIYWNSLQSIAYALLLASIFPGLLWHLLVYRYAEANIAPLIPVIILTVSAFLILAFTSKWLANYFSFQSPLVSLLLSGLIFAACSGPIMVSAFKRSARSVHEQF